jgi:hypothetical protein
LDAATMTKNRKEDIIYKKKKEINFYYNREDKLEKGELEEFSS